MELPKRPSQKNKKTENRENLSDKLVELEMEKADLIRKIKEEQPSKDDLEDIYAKNEEKYKKMGIPNAKALLDKLEKYQIY